MINVSHSFFKQLNLCRLSRIVCLFFLLTVAFLPYQTKWFIVAPQTVLLLLGLGLLGLGVIFQRDYGRLKPDWPLLLLIILLAASTIYHQTFNIYTRAYALSIATYIWLRNTLILDDILVIATFAKYVLLTHILLVIAQIFFGEAWYVARYLTNLGSYRIPLGLFDIPTTAALTPALIILFLFSMQARSFISGSLVLNICYLFTPLAILITSSRSALVSFLAAFLVITLLNVRHWRRTWFSITLLLIGFLLSTALLHRTQNNTAGAIFDFKIVQPVKSLLSNVPYKTIYNPPDSDIKKISEIPVKEVFIDPSVESRLQLWKYLLKEIIYKQEIMIRGIGLGGSEAVFKSLLESGELDRKVFGNQIISPHNSIVELFYEGGVFVGFALIFFLGSRIFNSANMQSPWFGSLLFLIIFMMFYDLLRMRYFWIVLAMVEVYAFLPNSNLLSSRRNFLNSFNVEENPK